MLVVTCRLEAGAPSQQALGNHKRATNHNGRQWCQAPLLFQLFHALLQTSLQIIRTLAGLAGVNASVHSAGEFLQLQFFSTVIPVSPLRMSISA
jgi:hypothetical protein